MPRKREDSFRLALEALRREVRAGVHPMGARLTANEIASRLSLSATPVREALWHLAGEGLIQEHRGQGFFIPRLSERDVGLLFLLQLELLQLAARTNAVTTTGIELDKVLAASHPGGERFDRLMASERLLRAVALAASPPLARHLLRLQDQLAPFRVAEAVALGDTSGELERLATSVAEGNTEATSDTLREYFTRRVDAAPTLVRLRETGVNIESI
ncbi:GntR family transcriptional regulator [Phenylobacterium sp. RIFCSPHIGHO2_01_FULL_69_31]|uniref:GntR family transcriptional regulator n=1 Tax=Phenylobacterium sp. RIFCSPHIGHO2_01_FULL_69_31 TaxID=1801944 RepID=UPI0025EAE220|nr:GntR family transcriptional regulator [Phenylobacterium sp. RIFCSPHIGHO2_01_FULL_69_31]